MENLERLLSLLTCVREDNNTIFHKVLLTMLVTQVLLLSSRIGRMRHIRKVWPGPKTPGGIRNGSGTQDLGHIRCDPNLIIWPVFSSFEIIRYSFLTICVICAINNKLVANWGHANVWFEITRWKRLVENVTSSFSVFSFFSVLTWLLSKF